jgi:hypothetical protein
MMLTVYRMSCERGLVAMGMWMAKGSAALMNLGVEQCGEPEIEGRQHLI